MFSVDKISNGKISYNTKTFTSNPRPLKFAEQPPDTVELSNKKTKKKRVGIAVALSTLATSAIALACMIGRNPAKAAKVLQGTSNVMDDVYVRGSKFADDVINKQGEFKNSIDDILKIFKKPKYKTKVHEEIANLEDYIRKNSIPEDSELVKALREFKGNYDKHIADVEKQLRSGNAVNEYNLGNKFASENNELIEKIRANLSFDYAGRSNFYKTDIGYSSRINKYIEDCPADLLPADGIFYHGTKNPRGIYREGFTPYKSRQAEHYARELGAGVYITPDLKVASYFSGLMGNIIPLKMQKGARIAYLDEPIYKEFLGKINKFLLERIKFEDFKKLPQAEQNAMMECLVNKIFTRAGYDAAYIPKGLKGGGIMSMLLPDINKVIGRNQQQVVVFKPENLEIVPRSFTERVCDIKDKFSTLRHAIKGVYS